jgi:hypothetical protein
MEQLMVLEVAVLVHRALHAGGERTVFRLLVSSLQTPVVQPFLLGEGKSLVPSQLLELATAGQLMTIETTVRTVIVSFS